MVRTMTRRIAAQTDCLIAPTGKVKRLLEDYRVLQPIYVVPTGIDRERFAAKTGERERMREELGIPADHTVLVFVGRLAKEKNCEELLRGFTRFRNAAVTLLFVGDGPCRGELERQVKDSGMERQILFAGMVKPEEVSRYYHAGDLFVSASRSETQGLTYLEALGSGLPMLCRRDGCLDGILSDDVNGWQYGTEEEFAQRLEQFLAHPEIRDEFSKAAVRISGGLSVSAFSENAERVYRERILRRHIVRQEVSA